MGRFKCLLFYLVAILFLSLSINPVHNLGFGSDLPGESLEVFVDNDVKITHKKDLESFADIKKVEIGGDLIIVSDTKS